MAHSPADSRNDPLNHYGRNIIRDSHAQIDRDYGVILRSLETSTRSAPQEPEPPLKVPRTAGKVGIIGGGIGGLYAAMLLQHRGIPYEILEASPRLGGRLHTHRMGDRPNDYFDLGAMRFPDTPIMKPLFDLFNRIGLKRGDFLFTDKESNSTLLYNDVNKRRGKDPVTPQDFEITGVPSKPWGELGWEENVDNVLQPFAQELIEDVRTGERKGWKLMMEYDQYSMKAYMAGNRSDARPALDKKGLMPYPLNVVNWCETFDSSSGSYDRALSENVLDSLAFSWDGSPIDWHYIVGGSSQLAIKLDEYMSQRPGYVRPFFDTRVTGISCVFENDMPTPFTGLISHPVEAAKACTSPRPKPGETLPPTGCVAVHLADGSTRYYSHVITTTTFPCLRTMNLTGARLDWEQKQAIRSLQYGPSTKIGVRFRKRWWEDDKWMKDAGAYGAIFGGQSYTDTMSRTVVYPSYGVGEPENGATIIVSYAWTNDALALTGLMGLETRDVLKQRVLQDLVEIHRLNPRAAAELEQLWEDMYPFSWTNNPHTLGAFAQFGPGEFKKMYPAVTRPAAGGRLHFAGEVCSVRHAWVVGALEASNRAVNAILRCSYPAQTAVDHEEEFGLPEGWTAELLEKQRNVAMTGAIPEFTPSLRV